MAGQTPIGSTKIPVALPFGTIAIGNAAGTLYTNVSSVTEYRMPSRGSVIGFAANLTGTLTTGTLQFYPTKNGSPMANSFGFGTINIGVTGNYQRAQAEQGGFSFAEGDTIGLAFNKTGTVAPTTRDCAALVLVLFDGYDY
jgi:hypothetical protein